MVNDECLPVGRQGGMVNYFIHRLTSLFSTMFNQLLIIQH